MELTPEEIDRLATYQRTIIEGQKAMEDRNWMLLRKFDEGCTHSSMAAAMNVACRDAGVDEVSVDAVYAAVKRTRARVVREPF